MKTPFFAPDAFRSGELLLRAYRPGDGAALREATLASYAHLRPWMAWARTDYPPDEAEALCRRLAASDLLGEDFVIGVRIGDELVGGTGFHLRGGGGPLAWSVAEIGMWIREGYAGKGLGTRVLGAMLDWGFDGWGWERLVWKCDVRNAASGRVAEKCGLIREATLRSAMLDVAGARCDDHLYADPPGGANRLETPPETQEHPDRAVLDHPEPEGRRPEARVREERRRRGGVGPPVRPGVLQAGHDEQAAQGER